jgi:hypothetical protein
MRSEPQTQRGHDRARQVQQKIAKMARVGLSKIQQADDGAYTDIARHQGLSVV